MSVQIVDTQILEYIAHGLKRLAYNKTVDQFFCSLISAHFNDKDVEAEALRLVKSWAYLNEVSYAVAYNEMDEPFTCADYVLGTKIFNLQPFQLFKYVFFLHYNIDIETIESKATLRGLPVEYAPGISDEQKADRKLLERWYYEYAIQLAECTPEYQQAKYSDPIQHVDWDIK